MTLRSSIVIERSSGGWWKIWCLVQSWTLAAFHASFKCEKRLNRSQWNQLNLTRRNDELFMPLLQLTLRFTWALNAHWVVIYRLTFFLVVFLHSSTWHLILGFLKQLPNYLFLFKTRLFLHKWLLSQLKPFLNANISPKYKCKYANINFIVLCHLLSYFVLFFDLALSLVYM